MDRYTLGNVQSAIEKLSREKEQYDEPLLHGTMALGFYKPINVDDQEPHDQDEIYIIASGSGTFMMNGKRQPFEAGEALFVPANVEHRFEDFTDDFAAWVVFYGPKGGEKA